MRSALLIGVGAWAFTWGAVPQDGSSGTFSITLDALGDGGAVVLTGLSAERPRGVFRATRGAIEMLSASPTTIEARFRLEARGFLAADPAVEDREVSVSGWFTAQAQRVAVSSAAAAPTRLP